MIAKIFLLLCKISPKVKVWMWKRWYQILAKFYPRKDWNFMNYGFASVGGPFDKLDLESADQEDRYCIQLYHHLASSINLKSLTVLEVGSGRGGGADYIMRYLKPKKMVGVDFSENAIEFCKQNYTNKGLSFVEGNAELLPFPDNSFDVVLNVESSHCYGSISMFLSQVKRVLQKNGYFLFTDFRSKDGMAILHKELSNSGLTLIKETDITPNVIEALKLDEARKIALIEESIYKPFVSTFIEFAGIKGSTIYDDFKSGKYSYQSFVLQKI